MFHTLTCGVTDKSSTVCGLPKIPVFYSKVFSESIFLQLKFLQKLTLSSKIRERGKKISAHGPDQPSIGNIFM
jgi:hypothetical protein